MKCDEAASLVLNGVITASSKGKRNTFSVAAIHCSISSDKNLTLTEKLPAAALARLKAGQHESVVFTLNANNAYGSRTTRAHVWKLTLA
jgi:hypothetical protein